MKKLNEILFSLISPVILGEGVSSETAAVDERTFRAVYALAKKHDLANLLAGAARCANAQMQNAECGMRNERTVGDAGPYGDTGCANAQMQNAECGMRNERTVGDAGPYGDTGCANAQMQNAKCKMQNGECGISAELMAELEKAELTAAWRVRNIENEQGRVRKCLEEAEIPFILLKGAVVRDFYPEAWMRTSSDIDVLVPRDELSHAVCAIEDGLGYRISTVEPHDASMYAKSGVHLDMHTLFEGDREDCKLLDEAWSMCANAQMQNAECTMQNGRTVGDAGPYGDTGCANTLSRKCKMQNAECKTDVPVEQMQNAKCKMQNDGTNRRAGACSRRDSHLWGSEAKPRESVGAIHESPDSIASPTVINAKECCTLAPSTASGPPPSRREAQDESPDNDADAKHNARSVEITTEQLSAFEEYVLTGGVYGSGEQYVAAKQRGGKQGKAKYVLGRIFMPYEQLKLRHPRLDGHRWLTPVFEVYRWCGLLVPSRLRRSKKELSSAMRVDNAKVTSVEELLNSLEL